MGQGQVIPSANLIVMTKSNVCTTHDPIIDRGRAHDHANGPIEPRWPVITVDRRVLLCFSAAEPGVSVCFGAEISPQEEEEIRIKAPRPHHHKPPETSKPGVVTVSIMTPPAR